MIGILNSLVNQHHNLYLKLFNDTLKPKFHNMKQYSEIMRMSGPLSRLSFLRYESKYRELKYIATSTTSRKKPCHTIAVKKQLRLCYLLIGKRRLSPQIELGDGDSLNSISLRLQVKINGTKYNVGLIVVIHVIRVILPMKSNMSAHT